MENKCRTMIIYDAKVNSSFLNFTLSPKSMVNDNDNNDNDNDNDNEGLQVICYARSWRYCFNHHCHSCPCTYIMFSV